MHKIRVFSYIFCLGLSCLAPASAALAGRVVAGEESKLIAAAKLRQSAIIEQDHLKGKISEMEEPLLTRSMIIPSQLRTPIDTRISKLGDLVTVETKEDLLLSEDVIVPAGSYLKGYISRLEKPGRMMKDPKIEVEFNSVFIAGQKEQIHLLGKLSAKQLDEKSIRLSDGASYKSKAMKAGLVGGVAGLSGGYVYTALRTPYDAYGIASILNKLTVVGMGVGGAMLGMSMITRDDARIETGTALDILVLEPSEAI